eukprot:SAG25_NODE_7143_length_502_cov_0.645161_1_plen_49_part_10
MHAYAQYSAEQRRRLRTDAEGRVRCVRNGWLLTRRGRSLPANASRVGTH